MDISMGEVSDRVISFLVDAYVRGMENAEKSRLEKATAVFSKRSTLFFCTREGTSCAFIARDH